MVDATCEQQRRNVIARRATKAHTVTSRSVITAREQIFTWKHRFRVKFWQDFGVVDFGVPQPPTALAVSVCTHTAQKPVAPPRLPL